MTVDTSEARLKFLSQAACKLSISAPTLSAALSSDHIESVIGAEEDLNNAKKEWDALRRKACGACGTLLLPGWSSSISLVSSSRPLVAEKGRSQRPTLPKKVIVTACLRCDRKSSQHLQARPPKHAGAKAMRGRTEVGKPSSPHKSAASELDQANKSANATSKQRKKARKGGLQAMLEKNKNQTGQGGLGLDLMDFMQ